MKNMIWALCAVILINLSSCKKGGDCDDPIEFNLQDTFQLCVGQSAYPSSSLPVKNIKFEKIVSDSRCPASVECFWAGLTEVQLSLELQDSTVLETVKVGELEVAWSGTVLLDGLNIQIVGVSPYPQTPDDKIEPDDYKVKLVVWK